MLSTVVPSVIISSIEVSLAWHIAKVAHFEKSDDDFILLVAFAPGYTKVLSSRLDSVC